jgi:DNA-binding MarR family transcriptional regulator
VEHHGPLGSPGFWLHHAALAWRQSFESRLAPTGLTHTQFTLLAGVSWLSGGGEPPTQQAVADFSRADRMMTSKVIRTLVQRGLLSRQPDPHDGRQWRLALTEAGQAVVTAGVRAAQATDDDLFPGEERGTLREALRLVAERRTAGKPRGHTN